MVGGALLAIAQQRFRPPVAGDRMGHGWSKLPGNRRRFETLTFEHQVELAPNPDNRVQIGSSVDRLGVQHAVADHP